MEIILSERRWADVAHISIVDLTAVRILCFDSQDNEDKIVIVDKVKLAKMSYGCQDAFCSHYILFGL